MKDVSVQEVNSAIDAEFSEYRNKQIALGAEAVFENAFKINAWNSIKDYLDESASDDDKIALYEKCGGGIIRNLVYEYVESEDCDIASYNDLADLVYGFLH